MNVRIWRNDSTLRRMLVVYANQVCRFAMSVTLTLIFTLTCHPTQDPQPHPYTLPQAHLVEEREDLVGGQLQGRLRILHLRPLQSLPARTQLIRSN